MKSIIAFLVCCVLVPFVLAQSNLRRASNNEVTMSTELEATEEMQSSDSSAKATMTVIMVSFFTDSTCKTAVSTSDNNTPNPIPYIWVNGNNKCVPNWFAGSSYILTVQSTGVMYTHFSDPTCTTQVFTSFQTPTQCQSSPINAGSPDQPYYMTIKAMNMPVGSLPSGDQFGTYMMIFTTDKACKAFDATTTNPVGNFVWAAPIPYTNSASAFGVPFNSAQALSCSSDGLNAFISTWNTKVGKNGALTVASTTPTVHNGPMQPCTSMGWGPSAYNFRTVCI